jgi:hypothetical protein
MQKNWHQRTPLWQCGYLHELKLVLEYGVCLALKLAAQFFTQTPMNFKNEQRQ